MLTVDTISFDTSGLARQAETRHERRWLTDMGWPVILEVVDGRSPFLVLLDEADPTAAFRRVVGKSGRGLVELSPIQRDGWVMLRLITKGIVDPQTGWGRSFLGLITIPFREASLVLRVEAHETEVTGLRESTIMGALLSSGTIRPKEGVLEKRAKSEVVGPGDFDGWLADPNDPTPPHLAATSADDPRYDPDFPTPPLSCVHGMAWSPEAPPVLTAN